MSFTATYSGLNSNSAPKSPWADIIPYISVDKNRKSIKQIIKLLKQKVKIIFYVFYGKEK